MGGRDDKQTAPPVTNVDFKTGKRRIAAKSGRLALVSQVPTMQACTSMYKREDLSSDAERPSLKDQVWSFTAIFLVQGAEQADP